MILVWVIITIVCNNMNNNNRIVLRITIIVGNNRNTNNGIITV